MIARLLIALLAVGLALVVTFAELDQQSRQSPALATVIPAPFSGNAARERAKLAMQLGQADLAIDEAREQLSMRPMPAESLTILALAALQSGDQDTARSALEAASRRGWREPISQLASGQAALDQGQYTVASQRAVALLSTGNLTDQAVAILARLLELPEGREAVADRLASFGRWQYNALLAVYPAADAGHWAETIALAQDRGAELDCDRLERLANAYRMDGLHEDAARFWPGHCESS